MKGRPAIALIGMPGAGKTTVGRWLAGHLVLPLVDTDRLVEAKAGQPLQAIIEQQGGAALLRLEGQVLAGLPAEAAIIATGGSAVYCAAGMARLRHIALVVYLQCGLEQLAQRISNPDTRGIVLAPGQSLAQLYAEREPLYRRYADLAVAAENRTPAEVGAEIGRHYAGGAP